MKNWFKNMRVASKFILGFGLTIVLCILIAIIGVTSATNMDSNYSYILEQPQRRMDSMSQVTLSIARYRRLTIMMAIYSGNDAMINSTRTEQEAMYNTILGHLDNFVRSLQSDPRREADDVKAILAKVTNLKSIVARYANEVGVPVMQAALGNDLDKTVEILSSGSQLINDMNDLADSLWQETSDYVDELSIQQTEDAQTSTRTLIILAVVAALVSTLMAVLTALSITKPVKQLVSITTDVAKGQLNVNSIPETKDEIGVLVKNVFTVINVVKTLVDDLAAMGHSQNDGDVDAKLDETKYNGSFKEVAAETNKMVIGHVDLILLFMDKIQHLVTGDFKVTLDKQPGKKAIMNDVLEKLRSIIMGINNEINGMAKNVSEGKCAERIDVEKYTGDWVKLMEGLNNVLQNYDTPIQEMTGILGKLAQGNFKEQMVGVYKGDFNLIKVSVNNMVTHISAYITEISEVLNQLANNNLDQGITREYVGEFSSIKNAINNIVDKFNGVIGEITSATDQVAAGARQISESSMTLAQGATEQASSVEELNATVMSVNEKTQLNAENAKRAADLSTELKEHAVDGNQQMKNMLASMKAINEASSSISKIITIIKDISFQTNLLALNASIEAAHAGVHGAGFSVVADEVRSLAVKSQEAANDTTELIETSIQRVNEGTNIAVKTDEALERIVSGVTEVSAIISGISSASDEQALAISHINDGVNQIAQVVQNNSATSEESASAAEELSSQSEMLKGMVKVFNLK